jgi:hypothetical protein
MSIMIYIKALMQMPSLLPKPDEPEPNKDYDRCLTKDEESDHGGCDVDGTLCG